MTKRILFLFIFHLMFFANAQTNSKITIESLVSNYVKELQSQKINTICVYESYCVGYEMTYDEPINGTKETCIDYLTNKPVYVFWKEDGKTFLTKINYCWEFSKIEVLKDDFWTIYFSNKDIINKEQIKKFAYVDHSCHNDFKFLIKNKIIEKHFDDFDLLKEYNSNINTNYNHNINLKSKTIIDILKKITSEAEKNNNFKKIKSR